MAYDSSGFISPVLYPMVSQLAEPTDSVNQDRIFPFEMRFETIEAFDNRFVGLNHLDSGLSKWVERRVYSR